jgi:glycosyltransferase involved in cell wall biosynthesis/predicted Zn-dependent protease
MPIQISDAYRNSVFAMRQTGLLFNLPVPDPDVQQLPEGISLCMIVKNEERFLAECLDSVKDVVDEICIVDTGSTDRTVEIARSYGAKVEFREWRSDFSWARNEALAMATRRWTLVLDADEELERESVGLLRSLRTTPAALTAVYINIVNLISDATGDGTMSHRLIRIFPTNPVLRYVGFIHESLARNDGGEMSAVITPIAILHKGYTMEMLTGREKDKRNGPLIVRAYEENAEDTFALFNFGNSAICSGNIEVGVEVLERMLGMPGTPKLYYPLAYLMLAQTYCESLGEPEKALEWAEKGAEAFPKDAGLIFTKGQVLVKLGRIDEARALFEDALNLREQMAYSVMTDEEIFEWKIFYSLAGTYARAGDHDRAIECIDKALANKPNAFHLQRAKASFLEGVCRYYDAEMAYRRMAEVDQRGRLELVNFLLRRSRFAQAIAIVENQDDNDANGDLISMLNVAAARAVLQSGHGDPAPFLEAALRRAPGNGMAISMMERLLTERGDVAALERLHRDELNAPCLRPEDFARRSFRLLALDRNEEAQAAADAGLQIDPLNPELRFNTALAALRLSDDVRAAREFSRVEAAAPHVYAEAQRIRAIVLLRQGQHDAARQALEARLSVLPGNGAAVVESARMLVAGGARAQARALLEAHVDDDSRVALELAGMLLQGGDLAGAGQIASTRIT